MNDVNPGSAAGRFELLPAIDLRGGRVVRLREGDFARETVYGDDPPEVVGRFRAAGATWLHVVDLDGAVAGRPVQAPVVASILAAVDGDLAVQVAGGIRDAAAVRSALGSGARRVVLGTAALADPSFAGRMVREHGADRIVVALDVRDGLAIGEGWRRGAAGTPVGEAARRMIDAGVGRLAVTAIARDGLLAGPDLRLLASIVDLRGAAVIASGGISTLDDLRAVRRVGCAGAIVGRALYEGTLDLAAAVAMLGIAGGRG
jgi:phosphoribosylformimino-5-aminoimidazole carboxamide ribotide isomerase